MPRTALITYAEAWIGRPYVWGGDDFAGFDCSGFVIEALKSVGKLPHRFDDTADGLWHRYEHQRLEHSQVQPGCLCFWFNSEGRATHTEVCRNGWQVIGASGGGAPRTTPEGLIHENLLLQAIFQDPANFKTQNPLFYWLLQRAIGYKDAVERDAYIKVRPITYRGLEFETCDPFKEAA